MKIIIKKNSIVNKHQMEKYTHISKYYSENKHAKIS